MGRHATEGKSVMSASNHLHATYVHRSVAFTSRPVRTSRPRPSYQARVPTGYRRRIPGVRTDRDEAAIAAITAEREIPNVHLPTWRLRFAIAVRLFPILWVLPKCSAPGCQKHWPCKPLLRHLRNRHGWTGSIAHHVKALSTKRRRAKASARNPTAISHRGWTRWRDRVAR